jgi:hypothetical protein
MARPRTLNPLTVNRILTEREAGRTLWAIAEGLRVDGVPTATGRATWFPATVAAVVRRYG